MILQLKLSKNRDALCKFSKFKDKALWKTFNMLWCHRLTPHVDYSANEKKNCKDKEKGAALRKPGKEQSPTRCIQRTQTPPRLWHLTFLVWPWPFAKVKKAFVIRCRLLYCTMVPGMMSMKTHKLALPATDRVRWRSLVTASSTRRRDKDWAWMI